MPGHFLVLQPWAIDLCIHVSPSIFSRIFQIFGSYSTIPIVSQYIPLLSLTCRMQLMKVQKAEVSRLECIKMHLVTWLNPDPLGSLRDQWSCSCMGRGTRLPFDHRIFVIQMLTCMPLITWIQYLRYTSVPPVYPVYQMSIHFDLILQNNINRIYCTCWAYCWCGTFLWS